MGKMAENRSKLVRMFVRNIGCIGADGVSIALDDVVCIVGRNNSGKSTLLRAYELAQGSEKFDWSRDRCANAPEDQPSEVILDIHIPEGIGNIGEEWKEVRDGLCILTSRWQWRQKHVGDGKLFPIRQTRRPGQPEDENEGYAEDGKAGGADNVFKSRLPQPVRIGSRGDPAEAEKARQNTGMRRGRLRQRASAAAPRKGCSAKMGGRLPSRRPSLAGMQTDLQGMSVAVEQVVRAMGGEGTRLSKMFRDLCDGTESGQVPRKQKTLLERGQPLGGPRGGSSRAGD